MYESAYNYYNDSRVRARESGNWFTSLDEKRMMATVADWQGEIGELPFAYEVCSLCGGKGSHVNPSIDCDGLTGEDFAEDPDFVEAYLGGQYDEPCAQCGGQRVYPEIDIDHLSEAQHKILDTYNEYRDAMDDIDAISRAERAMGA